MAAQRRVATAAPIIIIEAMRSDDAAAPPPTRFAAATLPRPQELLEAPFATPRPSLLAVPLPLKGRAAEAAASLGLLTLADLLEHVPRARREARSVAELQPGEQATVLAEVRSISQRPVRRRGMRPLVEAVVADDSGSMAVTFFNQPWLAQRYRPGTRLVLHGKYESKNRFRVSHHAHTDEVAASIGDAVAHYAATEGLSSTQILALMTAAREALAEVSEPLPGRLLAAERLPSRAAALEAMHFPRTAAEGEGGRRRLAFEELFLAQLALLERRARRAARLRALALDGPAALTERWLAGGLPFELTGDQRRAIETLRAELALPHPAQRLLMGEVGSGKTVVALYAMLRAVEHGAQAALMAPTETLAEQHFATLQALLGAEPVTLALLSGSTPAARRTAILERLRTGELSLLVGTHALIEDTVRFASLAVAVVDEQHRFGVRQRAALDAKGPTDRSPHLLHMTATPIPRTLALCIYGDLEQTHLRELPRGRRPIATHLISGARERARAYERIIEEVAAGRQAFVVCPLVEEALEGSGDARAATAEFERLRDGPLAGCRLVLLHGQLAHREKQAAMAAFASGAVDVLVTTTVIEVGVDVPNATVMLIENAERFGISQLHQLRGRVGRGAHDSICLLCGPPGSPRLRALVSHDDGFRLAEIDLELRKEGDLVGVRQSGSGQFRVAELPQDEPLLARARERALALIELDPQLERPEHALLATALHQERELPATHAIPA